jgi:hypothetical protein
MKKNDVKIIELNQFNNREEFINIVENELINKFRCTVDNLPENYGIQKNWSLLSLLKNNQIDCYSLIYVNGIFYGGSGGMIRPNGIYQAGFRMFSQSKTALPNLSTQYYNTYNLKNQIERAKQNNCRLLVLSFNEHNERFFNFTKNKCIPAVFGDQYNFEFVNTPVIFNGVKQYLIKLDIGF